MNLFEFIEEYWLFLSLLVTIISWGIRLEGKVNGLQRTDEDQEKRLDDVGHELRKNDTTFTEIKIAITKIEVTLQEIKERLAKL